MTSTKLLIVFGTLDSYTNLKQLVSQERFLTGSKVISLTDDNVLFFQVYLLSGTLSEQVCLCYDIKPVRKEEGKSYWKIPLCDDDATREK